MYLSFGYQNVNISSVSIWGVGAGGGASTVLGARLRGRTATQRSKKGSEKLLRRVLGRFSEGLSEGVLRTGFPEDA